jgi:hypothetical protein
LASLAVRTAKIWRILSPGRLQQHQILRLGAILLAYAFFFAAKMNRKSENESFRF